MAATSFTQTVLMQSNHLVWGKDTLYMKEVNVWYLNLNDDHAVYTVFENEVPIMVQNFEFRSVSFADGKTHIIVEAEGNCKLTLKLNSKDCSLDYDGLVWLGSCEVDFQTMLKNEKNEKNSPLLVN